MKSMTLPVRNFSLFLIAAVLVLAGCDKKKDVNPSQADLYGKVARPTWTAVENPDMTTSMTAVVAVKTLSEVVINDTTVSEKDLLAAFSGEKCVSVAQYDKGLFFLYIPGMEGEITLRYFSAHYTNLFEAKDAFRFVNDTQKGTPAEPFVPALKMVEE